MAKLILTLDGAVLHEFPLDKPRLTIGRKPENDIQLNDATVSGVHAAVLLLQNAYLEDLGSTNGTELNGRKVQKRMLSHGDIFRIGQHQFEFVEDLQNQDFEKTVVLTAPRPAAATAAAPAAATQASVELLNGPGAGKVYPLTRPHTTFGKPGVQVAVIARRGDSFVLTPMAGVGHPGDAPRVNDEPVTTSSRLLQAGDVIEVAGSRLRFSSH